MLDNYNSELTVLKNMVVMVMDVAADSHFSTKIAINII